jgi:hypothetical protein
MYEPLGFVGVAAGAVALVDVPGTIGSTAIEPSTGFFNLAED